MDAINKSFLKPSDLALDILSEKNTVTEFDSGDPDYDDFIKNHALKHQQLKLGTTYLFFYKDTTVSFYGFC